MPKTYVIPSADREVISVIFPNGINKRFLQTVRTVYDINDSSYSSLGLERPISNEGGHVVIYHRKSQK